MKMTLLALLLFIFAPAAKDIPASIYDYKVPALNGSDIDFSAFKGKKILIVNAPWFDNYDPQYKELDQLYKKYSNKLVVVAFLSDDFGIPPGAGKIATEYRKKDYYVSYPIAARVGIKGSSRAPIFMWLTEKEYNKFESSEAKWNFQKYLLDESGHLINVFEPKVHANDPRLIAAIEN
jgi:glutathione peroxidase